MRRLAPGTRLVVASHNPGKVWEIRKLIAPYGLDAISAGDLNLPEPEETELTFSGNARLKALAASRGANLPALADDSGLEVDCLDGAPGVVSANWAGPGRDFALAMDRVAAEVSARNGWAIPGGPRANFVSVLCLAFPDGATHAFEGKVHGRLVWPKRGANGFGYDPMFQPDGKTETFGEMDPARKNALSHRARAFAAFEAACLDPAGGASPLPPPTALEGLDAAARSISSREEFVRFLAALRDDLKSNPATWENPTLDRYLDALGGYLTDASIPPEPVWRTLARALLAASRYE